MRMCSIASGSSGNCIYVGSGSHHLLIDAGISGKRVEAGLKELQLSGKDIDGILLTHEHSDHIKGLGVLSRKYDIPIYATPGTAEAVKAMPEKIVPKSAYVDNAYIDAKGIKALADMPSREELIAKMLGSMQAPIANFAGVLSAMLRGVVVALNAIAEKKA